MQLGKETLLRYKVTYAQKYSHDKTGVKKEEGEEKRNKKRDEFFSLKSYILCKMLLAQLKKKERSPMCL